MASWYRSLVPNFATVIQKDVEEGSRVGVGFRTTGSPGEDKAEPNDRPDLSKKFVLQTTPET